MFQQEEMLFDKDKFLRLLQQLIVIGIYILQEAPLGYYELPFYSHRLNL